MCGECGRAHAATARIISSRSVSQTYTYRIYVHMRIHITQCAYMYEKKRITFRHTAMNKSTIKRAHTNLTGLHTPKLKTQLDDMYNPHTCDTPPGENLPIFVCKRKLRHPKWTIYIPMRVRESGADLLGWTRSRETPTDTHTLTHVHTGTTADVLCAIYTIISMCKIWYMCRLYGWKRRNRGRAQCRTENRFDHLKNRACYVQDI